MSENASAVKYANKHFKEVIINQTGRLWTTDEIIHHGQNCEVLIVGLDKIDQNLVSALPHLKCISKYGVGTDNIDVHALKPRSIQLLLAPGTNKQSVTELVIFKLLEYLRVGCPANAFRRGYLDHGQWRLPNGRQLKEASIGIIGLGNVGTALSQTLLSLGCQQLYGYDTDPTKYIGNKVEKCTSILEIARLCEIISVHIPSSTSNNEILNEIINNHSEGQQFLINTSRASLVDKKLLVTKLKQSADFFYYSDVWEPEPMSESERIDLLTLPNFDLTPHIGGSTSYAVQNMAFSALENVIEWSKRQ